MGTWLEYSDLTLLLRKVKEVLYSETTNPTTAYTVLTVIYHYNRKVLLEPNGIKGNLLEFHVKLSVFRKHGEYVCLIIIAPDGFIKKIDEYDPGHTALDFLRKQL